MLRPHNARSVQDDRRQGGTELPGCLRQETRRVLALVVALLEDVFRRVVPQIMVATGQGRCVAAQIKRTLPNRVCAALPARARVHAHTCITSSLTYLTCGWGGWGGGAPPGVFDSLSLERLPLGGCEDARRHGLAISRLQDVPDDDR